MGPHKSLFSHRKALIRKRFVTQSAALACFIAALLGFAIAHAPSAYAQPVSLHPIVTAPPGSEQAYLITGRQWELDALPERYDDLELRTEEAVELPALYVRYRVLEPAPDGALRIEVYAQLVDSATGAPLAHPVWSDVMRVTPGDVTYEGGETPAWAIVMTEEPDWLATWLSRAEDVPQGPVEPGATWSSQQDGAALGIPDEFHTRSAYLDIVGTFLGWSAELVPDQNRPAAVVNERFVGALQGELAPFGLPEDCEEGCTDGIWVFPFEIKLDGEAQLWLLPGDFPLGGRSAQMMEVAWDTGIETVFAYGEVAVERFDGAFPEVAPIELLGGDTFQGVLGPESLRHARDGSFTDAPTDLYAFSGTEGHQALATMTSYDLRPDLILLNEAGNTIALGQYYSDGDQNISEIYVDLPYTGTYYLQATTEPGLAGGYTLSLETGPGIEYTPPSDLFSWDDFWSIFESLDWESFDFESQDPDSWDWDSWDWDSWDWDSEDWDSFDWDYYGMDYTQCEALRTGAFAAVPVKPGAPATRTLPADTDVRDCEALPHLYQFQGKEGAEVLIQLVSDDFDSYLVLLDDEWKILTTDDDSTGALHAQVYTTLPYSGTYYVLAGESTHTSYKNGGRYTLYLDSGETVPELLAACGYGRFRTPVDLGGVGEYVGYFSDWSSPAGCEPAYELFSFWAETGDAVVIDAVSSDFDTVLALTDAGLATLVEDDDSGDGKNARIETTIAATGRYFVKLQAYWPTSYGYYTLGVSVNGSAPVSPGSPQTGEPEDGPGSPGPETAGPVDGDAPKPDWGEATPWDLAPAAMPDCYELWEANALYLETGDWLYEDLNENEAYAHKACVTRLFSYSFDAEAGDEVLIEVYADQPRTYVALYDAGWNLIAASDTDAAAFASIYELLGAAGRYYFVAGAYDAEYAPGGYTVYLDYGPNLFDMCWTPGTLELVSGELVTQERSLDGLPGYCSGLSDMYAFWGEAGETVTLEMRSFSFSTFLEIYDDAFNALAFAEPTIESGELGLTSSTALTLTLPYTGAYYVEANMDYAFEGLSGTYSLRFEREEAEEAGEM